jgi:AbrB family looped-hinge helix DNA binding protein
MGMTTAVLDKEGRITLPDELRKRMSLRPGDTVSVEVHPTSAPEASDTPPWAHESPDWRAMAAARAALAGGAPEEEPMSLDEAREVLANRSAWASRADKEDGVSYVQRLRDEWAERERRLFGHDDAR